MKNSNRIRVVLTWFLLLLFLNVETGCHYYSIRSSKKQEALTKREALENEIRKNKNIFIFANGNYYGLSDFKYDSDTTMLIASCKTDTSYHHLYNPYLKSKKRYKTQKGEKKVLNEVFVVADSVMSIRNNEVTIPFSSITRIDVIKNNPSRGAGNVCLFLLGAVGIGIIYLGESLGWGDGGYDTGI